MTAQHHVHHVHHEGLPTRTTLLELVQSLTRPGRTPDEVVRAAHESIDQGRVILIGNFRGGLGVATHVHAALHAPTRRRNPRSRAARL